ncbi:MAG TPA: hypothetical protein VMC03_05650 [Streptosporangiaceae bacterium]|nr:hypothetical protein [Streptosporangiaceae bacterium]
MDNTHQPPGGEPQDFWATQEIRPGTGEPGQARQPGEPAPPWQQPGWGQPTGHPGHPGRHFGHPGHPGQRPPRRGKALWWGAGLALVAVLAGGGAFAATHLTGSTSPAAASTGTAGPTGQAAQLNALLNSASSPSSAATADSFAAGSAGTTAGATGTDHPCLSRAAKILASGHQRAARLAVRRCHVLRGVRVLGGIHGQFTFKTKSGAYKTLAYERGVIQSVTGNDVTVQATDGTTWTWVLVGNSVVRHGGQKVATSELADGQQVFAGGPVVSGVYDARLIVIRPTGATTPAPSAGPSSSPASGS